MSKNLPSLKPETALAEPTSDFSLKDLADIQDFVDRGTPGINSLEEHRLERIMNLYLSGKTYRQISIALKLEKPLVLFLSHKFDWYSMKKEYLNELEVHMRNRVMDSKLMNQDFLLQLQNFWQTKIGRKINEYLATGDSTFAEQVDPKDVSQYLKTIEVLHKLNGESSGKSSDGKPTVGLNLGDGVTIKKIGENQVEITPKERTIGDMLKKYADSRRAEANKDKNEDSDIDEETHEGDGDV